MIKNTDVLFAHLPNFVIREGSTGQWNKQIFGMFIDIDGFTQLSEEYGNLAHQGIDELTVALNEYFSLIVKSIHAFHGDVVHFAGDAVFCLWEVDDQNNDDKNQMAWNVIRCALDIHKQCDFYKTPLGKVLTLKTAISYGEAIELILTTKNQNGFYFVYGKAIEHLQACERLSERTRIYITKQVWDFISLQIYKQEIDFNFHHTVTTSDEHIDVIAILNEQLNTSQIGRTRSKSLTLSDRLEVRKDQNTDLLSFSRLFITNKLILNEIEKGELTDRLSELRHITACFINLEFNVDEANETFAETLSQILTEMESISYEYKGQLLKITTFDKGWTALLAFGLPQPDNIGKVKNKASNALISTYLIKQSIERNSIVKACSVGIATGLCYCGVIGHPSRHEYTCIGNRVNMGARLMTTFVNQISCDEETFWLSRMKNDNFIDLPIVYLKGIGNQKVRRLITISSTDSIQSNEQLKDVLFGHRMEIFLIAAELIKMARNETNRHRLFMIECNIGSDKTSLINFLAYVLRKSKSVVPIIIRCEEPDKIKPLDAIRCLMKQLIKISQMKKSALENDDLLIVEESDEDLQSNRKLSELKMEEDELLNDDTTYFLFKTIQSLTDLMFFFAVDDLQYMDKDSLTILSKLSICSNVVIVATVHKLNSLSDSVYSNILGFMDNVQNQLTLNSQTLSTTRFLRFTMSSLTKADMYGLVCHHCDVEYLECDLLENLYDNFRMHPAVCIEAIEELLYRAELVIQKPIEGRKYYYCKFPKTHAKNLIQKVFESRLNLIKIDNCDDTLALSTAIEFKTKIMPSSVEQFLYQLYDSLDKNMKLVLDVCATVGRSMSRAQIRGICGHSMNKFDFAYAIQVLMSSHILTCARLNKRIGKSANHNLSHKDSRSSMVGRVVSCNCPENHTDIAFMCKFLRFSMDSMRWSLFNRQTSSSRQRHMTALIEWLEQIYTELFCERCCPVEYGCVFDCTDGDSYFLEDMSKDQGDIETIVTKLRLAKIEKSFRSTSPTPSEISKVFKEESKGNYSWKRIGKDILLNSIINGTHSLVNKVLISIQPFNQYGVNDNFFDLHQTKTRIKILFLRSIDQIFDVFELDKFNIDESLLEIYLDEVLNIFKTSIQDKQENYSIRECQCLYIAQRKLKELIRSAEVINDYCRVIFYNLQLALTLVQTKKKSFQYIQKARELLDKCRKNLLPIDKDKLILVDIYYNFVLSSHYMFQRDIQTATNCLRSGLKTMNNKLHKLSIGSNILMYFMTLVLDNNLHCSIPALTIKERKSHITILTFYLLQQMIKNAKNQLSVDRSTIYFMTILDQLCCINKCSIAIKMCDTMYSMLDSLIKENASNNDFLITTAHILVGSCLCVVSYRLIQNGLLLDGNKFATCSELLFSKIKSYDNVLICLPILYISLTNLKKIDDTIFMFRTFKSSIDNNNFPNISKALNLYYTMCVDFQDDFGLQIHENIDMDKLSQHAQMINDEDDSHKYVLFCFATIAQSQMRQRLYSNGRLNFVKALRLLASCNNSDIHKITINNPLVQKSLTKLIECQLIDAVFSTSKMQHSFWLLNDAHNYIFKESMYYPMVLFYRCVIARLGADKKQHDELIEDILERLDAPFQSKLIKEWIEYNILAFSHGLNKKRSERRCTYWKGSEKRIKYFILPI